MAYQPGESGNPNGARKSRRFEHAILAEIAALEGDDLVKGLRRLAKKLVASADSGDEKALAEVGNRIDGKPAQQIIHSGDQDSPLTIGKVLVEIVDAAKP